MPIIIMNRASRLRFTFNNALWLRWQLDQKEEAPALPAKAEETAATRFPDCGANAKERSGCLRTGCGSGTRRK